MTDTSSRECKTTGCKVILDASHPYAVCNKCWKIKNKSTYNNTGNSSNKKEMRHFGQLEKKKKCSSCDTNLSIYNPYDLCNNCRRRELDKEVLKHRGVQDTVYQFDKDHQRKLVRKYSVDTYDMDDHNVGY